MKLRLANRQSGQTLVDLVVALALLSSSVASAGVLSTTTNRVSDESGRRAQAVGLADREMEGMLNYRDSLVGQDVSAWGSSVFGTNGCANFVMTRTGGDWSATTVSGPVSYAANDGGEGATYSAPNSPFSTFSREVTSCPAYDYQQTDYAQLHPTGPLEASLSNTVRTVTVTVQWPEANGTRSLTYRTMISDWAE